MENTNTPPIQDVENFLQEYGWKYKKSSKKIGDELDEVLLAPFAVDRNSGILISFSIAGEFLMVSTIDFMYNVPQKHLVDLFELNDKVKLVKIYPISTNPLHVEVGFELWAEAFNKNTFFAFMDMLGLAIDNLLRMKDEEKIFFESKTIKFE